MWSLIKAILIRVAAVRLIFRLFGGVLLLPLAFLLKVIGLPVLLILGIVAVPLLFVLFVLGLPIFMVLILGGLLLALLSTALTIGMAVLKLAITVGIPLYLVWMLVTFLRGRRGRCDPPPAADESTL